jgi:hypothetical protein
MLLGSDNQGRSGGAGDCTTPRCKITWRACALDGYTPVTHSVLRVEKKLSIIAKVCRSSLLSCLCSPPSCERRAVVGSCAKRTECLCRSGVALPQQLPLVTPHLRQSCPARISTATRRRRGAGQGNGPGQAHGKGRGGRAFLLQQHAPGSIAQPLRPRLAIPCLRGGCLVREAVEQSSADLRAP